MESKKNGMKNKGSEGTDTNTPDTTSKSSLFFCKRTPDVAVICRDPVTGTSSAILVGLNESIDLDALIKTKEIIGKRYRGIFSWR